MPQNNLKLTPEIAALSFECDFFRPYLTNLLPPLDGKRMSLNVAIIK
jgi:hypothetical protein